MIRPNFANQKLREKLFLKLERTGLGNAARDASAVGGGGGGG